MFVKVSLKLTYEAEEGCQFYCELHIFLVKAEQYNYLFSDIFFNTCTYNKKYQMILSKGNKQTKQTITGSGHFLTKQEFFSLQSISILLVIITCNQAFFKEQARRDIER